MRLTRAHVIAQGRTSAAFHTQTRVHTARTRMRGRAHTHTHTYARIHTHTHARTHTHTHKHTHTLSLSLSLSHTHTRTHAYTHKHTLSLSHTQAHTPKVHKGRRSHMSLSDRRTRRSGGAGEREFPAPGPPFLLSFGNPPRAQRYVSMHTKT